jgi:hypothetical protein
VVNAEIGYSFFGDVFRKPAGILKAPVLKTSNFVWGFIKFPAKEVMPCPIRTAAVVVYPAIGTTGGTSIGVTDSGRRTNAVHGVYRKNRDSRQFDIDGLIQWFLL